MNITQEMMILLLCKGFNAHTQKNQKYECIQKHRFKSYANMEAFIDATLHHNEKLQL